SIYSGSQVIIVKTDGTTFSNGDPWKCITCGIPAANKQGASSTVDHPQAFHDGMRAVVGTNVLDCAPYPIDDDACTPAATHMYPLVSTSGTTTGFIQRMRELRATPDDTHLGGSSIVSRTGGFDEIGFMGRRPFNPAPTTGTPLAPRYDLKNVTAMMSQDAA